MRSVPVMILAFIIYIIVTGSITAYDVITGAVTALAAGLLFGRHLVSNPRKALNPVRWGRFALYFLKYITVIEAKAHADVIRRIISGDVRPGIVKVPLDLRDEYARFLVAASITNTPGTVTVHMDDRYAYVNWINVSTSDPEKRRKEILEEFEENAKKIFEGGGA
ncbi:Na+/H+ antiporter subunit E [Thermococcus pacificus]|uniref:Cation:proton antiporter n=1 Tax=Thermococcus pacificus TaxID=71998 RepID=A0A218P8A6_9EURY|nr:Na+/H+ antiporter subunit E [Thermococcus pacificus]ASJ07009.1 cation:proton antiporter [Thermococcus pacificus]